MEVTVEKFVDLKEWIAAEIFDFEYEDAECRPHEEECHKIAEIILDGLNIKK